VGLLRGLKDSIHFPAILGTLLQLLVLRIGWNKLHQIRKVHPNCYMFQFCSIWQGECLKSSRGQIWHCYSYGQKWTKCLSHLLGVDKACFRYPIRCSLSKPQRFKYCSQTSWLNFGVFDSCKIRGGVDLFVFLCILCVFVSYCIVVVSL